MTPDKVLQMALKGQLSNQQKIRHTFRATHKEQNKTLTLHSKQEDRKCKDKGKRKMDVLHPKRRQSGWSQQPDLPAN